MLATTTGDSAQWWKETHQIRSLEFWPAQSPDLNPIEHFISKGNKGTLILHV